MNRLVQRLSVTAGFALMVVLLVVNTIVIRTQLGIQAEDQAWVVHSREVRLALDHLELLLASAETGQRGFLLTGDAKYLSPYNLAIVDIDAQIDKLAHLTGDNAIQQMHVANVKTAAHDKLSELAQTIDLATTGDSEQARQRVQTDKGLLLMRKFQNEIDQMKQEEATLEAARDSAYERSQNITAACVYLTTGVAGLGLLLLANFIIRERRTRERFMHELAAREEKFRVTLTSIGDAVIATDAEGKVTFVNPVAEKLTGIHFDDAVGKDIFSIFPIFNEVTGEKAENPVTKVMNLGLVVGLANHTVLKHLDGHFIPIEDSAAPIRDDRGALVGTVLVFHDVTTERNAQEVLRKTEKLATAARLSATVAHEINNPLEAVTNLIYIAKALAAESPEIVQHLTLAEQELERVAHITRQTLGFYRDSNKPQTIKLALVVEEVLNLYKNKIESRDIHVENKASECPPIWGATGEMKQVVSNLLSNAIDAVPRGGNIMIHCARYETPEGLHAELVIEDSGPGVAHELHHRIFDPFFTTKEDVGTGLGLWVTKEIVERHGGTIALRDGVGAANMSGAAFVIRIPAMKENREQASTTARIQ